MRHSAARALFWVSAVSTLVGLLVLATGGLVLQLGPWRVSSTDPLRPTVVAVMAFMSGALLVGVGAPDPWVTRLERLVSRVAPGLAAAATGTAAFVGIVAGTFVAGGADSSGYVSQAELWLSGGLHVATPLAALVTLDVRPEWALAPLGYRPAVEPGALVPTYPPGLPLMMALFSRVGGPSAVYYVVPLLGAAVVGATYRLARLLAGRTEAAVASSLVLVSPIVLYQLLQPMSDIPVTAWWLAAVVGAWTVRSPWGWLGTGLLVSGALATRPNLVPLAALLAAVPLLRLGASRPGRVAALVCALGMLPGVAVVLAVNHHLYGSPLRSGYGALDVLYGVEHVLPNLMRYGAWLLETHTPLVLAGLVAPWMRWRDGTLPGDQARRLAGFGVAFCLLLLACYLPYLEFDNWTFLRFLLPAVPVLVVLAVTASGRLLSLAMPHAALLLVLLAWGLCVTGVRDARERGTFDLARREHRYRAAAEWVDEALSDRTVIFAMQHSGSVSHYAGRTIIRYDIVGTRLDELVRGLAAAGHEATLVVDAWEAEEIPGRFPGGVLTRLDWPGLEIAGGVAAYDLTARLDALDRAEAAPRR